MSRAEVESMLLGRRNVADPSAELMSLRAKGPLVSLTFADGHHGWLVTGRDLARQVLTDARFSARAELRRHPTGALGEVMGVPAPPGAFGMMDPPEHTRLRRLLTGQFTVRRMQALTPRIEGYVARQLAQVRDTGPPAELMRDYAVPIPSLVICDLLGVPYADRDSFQQAIGASLTLHAPPEHSRAARRQVADYLADLVADKKRTATDDLLGGLISTGALSDTELVSVGHVLLAGGFETTANMIGLGTFLLLRDKEQLDALRADPTLVPSAVEELLRFCSIAGTAMTRAATEDVNLDGRTIRAGEVVAISVPAVNRDPEVFAEPDRLELARHRAVPAGHLAFGHGVHQCIGQQLARAELRVAFPALFAALPGLRLAVPAERIPLRSDMLVYGVHELPVRW